MTQKQLSGMGADAEGQSWARAAELERTNLYLRDSRRAALNLMEDAVAARREAEGLATALKLEQHKLAEVLASVRGLHAEAARRNIELEAANRGLEAYVYSVSHDLRAPLRSLALFSGFLLRGYGDRLDERGQDMLARVAKASERMNQTIENLLRLAQISRQELQFETVDVSALADSVIADLQDADANRLVAVTIAAGVTARTDRQLMRLALFNLLGNAWKFTGKAAAPRLEFGTETKEGRTVYFVRDNGIGFDPAAARQIFLPFHRLQPDTAFEGTGIGLTIVEHVVQRLGGAVWAEGAPGAGATFFFTLDGQQ